MKEIFKNIDKVINREIDKYTCPFCKKKAKVYKLINDTNKVMDKRIIIVAVVLIISFYFNLTKEH